MPNWLEVGIAYYALAIVIFTIAFSFPARDVNFTSPAILLSLLLLIPVYIWMKAQRNKTESSESTRSKDKATTFFMIFTLFALALSVRIPSVLLLGEPYEKTPLILLLVATVMLLEKVPLTNFGFKIARMGRSLLYGAAFFVVFGLVGGLLPYALIYAFTGQMPIQSFNVSMVLLILPFMTLCVGISEEGLFRGYVQTKLEKHYSAATAIVTQAILFGLWHFVWNLYPFDAVAMAQYVGITFFFGLLFGYFYSKTRNLAPLVLAHGLWNTVPTAIIQSQSVINYFGTFSPAAQFMVLMTPYLLAYLLAFVFVKYAAKPL